MSECLKITLDNLNTDLKSVITKKNLLDTWKLSNKKVLEFLDRKELRNWFAWRKLLLKEPSETQTIVINIWLRLQKYFEHQKRPPKKSQ